MKNTLQRYEKKYLLNKNQYEMIKEKLTPYTKVDKYSNYTVCNLYFDTESYQVIRHSIDKPVFKEKLRIRSYGVVNDDAIVYLELKKKYDHEVIKRRLPLTFKQFEDYIYKGIRPDLNNQILREIDHYVTLNKPYPRIYIAYEREALQGIEDESFRITFDKNIRFRNDDLSLTKGLDGKPIIEQDQCLMEIKTKGSIPLWFSQIITQTSTYPQSFSKYGYCYQTHLDYALV